MIVILVYQSRVGMLPKNRLFSQTIIHTIKKCSGIRKQKKCDGGQTVVVFTVIKMIYFNSGPILRLGAIPFPLIFVVLSSLSAVFALFLKQQQKLYLPQIHLLYYSRRLSYQITCTFKQNILSKFSFSNR